MLRSIQKRRSRPQGALKRPALVGALAVAGCLGAAGSASAASLSLNSSANPRVGQPVNITQSYSTDHDSYISVFAEAGGTSCGSTYQAEQSKSGPERVVIHAATLSNGDPAASSYQDPFTPGASGTNYLLCGYLTNQKVADTEAPDALTSIVVSTPGSPPGGSSGSGTLNQNATAPGHGHHSKKHHSKAKRHHPKKGKKKHGHKQH